MNDTYKPEIHFENNFQGINERRQQLSNSAYLDMLKLLGPYLKDIRKKFESIHKKSKEIDLLKKYINSLNELFQKFDSAIENKTIEAKTWCESNLLPDSETVEAEEIIDTNLKTIEE